MSCRLKVFCVFWADCTTGIIAKDRIVLVTKIFIASRRVSHRFEYFAHPFAFYSLCSAVLWSTALLRWTDNNYSYQVSITRFNESNQKHPEISDRYSDTTRPKSQTQK